MKNYESCFDPQLLGRLPIIIRIDGRAFHTLTRNMEKPWDSRLVYAMNKTAILLCREVSGTILAYVQSDEISLLIHPYQKLESEAWFGGRLQKMVSISAACASVELSQRLGLTALFDSRAFVLPEGEITNYFLWRQRDAERNSIQSLARSLASHKECTDLNNSQLQELCFQRGRNWNNLATCFKRGRCVIKTDTGWTVDNEIPRFVGEGRAYIERRFFSENKP